MGEFLEDLLEKEVGGEVGEGPLPFADEPGESREDDEDEEGDGDDGEVGEPFLGADGEAIGGASCSVLEVE